MKANPVWTSARDDLLKATTDLGYPEELGHEIVRNLGWLKAMQRMTAYLRYVKPNRPELVVDEMLAIRLEFLIKNPFSYYQMTYGWLFDLSAEDLEGETATSIPEDLMGCIRESLKEKCRWMILDADAPEWKPLPAFREEWDKMGYFRIAEELSIKDGI